MHSTATAGNSNILNTEIHHYNISLLDQFDMEHYRQSEIKAYPILVYDINDDSKLACILTEGNKGHTAHLNEAFKHLKQKRW